MRALDLLVERVSNALGRLVMRGIISSVDDTTGPYQRLSVHALAGEFRENVHHLQPYGLSSKPNAGSQVLLLSVGGAPDHLVGLVASDEDSRPTITIAGTVILHGEGYTAVRCKPNGDVQIEGGGGSVVLTVDASGDLTIDAGNVTIGDNVTIDGKDFLTHTHPAGTLLDSVAGACSGATGGVS